jgi:hypothetical protein
VALFTTSLNRQIEIKKTLPLLCYFHGVVHEVALVNVSALELKINLKTEDRQNKSSKNMGHEINTYRPL